MYAGDCGGAQGETGAIYVLQVCDRPSVTDERF